MAVNDNYKWLYDSATKEGFNVGSSLEEFTGVMKDPESRKWVFDKVRSKGYDLGDYTQYEEALGFSNKQNREMANQWNIDAYERSRQPTAQQPTAQQPTANADGTVAGTGSNSFNGAQTEQERNAMKEFYENGGGKEQLSRAEEQIGNVVDEKSWAKKVFGDGDSSEERALHGAVNAVFKNAPTAIKYFTDIAQRWIDPEYGQARSLQEKIKETKTLLDEAAHSGNSWGDRQLLGILRGAWDSASNIRTWDFGVNDLTDTYNINNLLDKAESGEDLTASEQSLLDACALTEGLQQAYQDDVSMGYRVGASVPQSAGFAASIAMNPIGGLGKNAAKGIVQSPLIRQVGRRFGKWGMRTLYGATRATGDAAEALVTTMTTGLPRTLSNIGERMEGQAAGDFREDGTYAYVGQEGREDAETATRKGLISSFFENESEMAGEYLEPVKDAVKNLMVGSVSRPGWRRNMIKWLTESSDGDVTRALNDFKERTHISGLMGEYAEEVLNNFADAAVIGDMNFTGGVFEPRREDYASEAEYNKAHDAWSTSVFNAETNLETLLSCAAMIGPMKAVEFGERRYNSYHAGKELKLRENALRKAYDGEGDNADYIMQRFNESGDFRDMGKVYGELLTSGVIDTPEKQRAVVDWVKQQVEYQTINTRNNNKRAKTNALQNEYADAYNAGLGMGMQDYHKANNEYEKAEAEAISLFGVGGADQIAKSNAYEFNNLLMAMDAEQRRVAKNLYMNRGRVTGIKDSGDITTDAQVKQFEQDIAPGVQTDEEGNRFVSECTYVNPQTGKKTTCYVTGTLGNNTAIFIPGEGPKIVRSSEIQGQSEPMAYNEYIAERRKRMRDINTAVANWNLSHNPNTVVPQVGKPVHISTPEGAKDYMVVSNGSNGQFGVVPTTFNSQTGQLEATNGEPIYMPWDELLARQDEAYDAEEDRNRIEAIEPIEAIGGEGQTAANATGTVAGQPSGAQQQLEQSEDGRQAMRQLDAWMSTEDAEDIPSLIDTLQVSDSTKTALEAYYRDRIEAIDAIDAIDGGAGTAAETETETPPAVGPTVRGKDNKLERGLMEQSGNVGVVAAELKNDYPDNAVDIARSYAQISQEEADSEKDPIKKIEVQRRVQFWNDVAGQLQPTQTAAEQRKAEAAKISEEARQKFPAIAKRWEDAPKVRGRNTVYIMPDGTVLQGHYVLTEAGAFTPSHDAHTFKPNEGFPTTEQGRTANSRDYENSTEAQNTVTSYGQSYNGNALQDPVVVSQDGVVYSGNNRAMSGQLASENGTDQAYLDVLNARAEEFGFTQEDMAGMQHPRVVFVAEEGQGLDYTPNTFDRFNAQREKGESAIEQAVKLGKVLADDVLQKLTDIVSGRAKLGDVYKSQEDCKAIVDILQAAGVVSQGTRVNYLDSRGLLTEQGKQTLEGALIGKVFSEDEDAVRFLSQMPQVRKRVIEAISEISANRLMGEFSLSDELADAIRLLYQADKAGMSLKEFYDQGDFTMDVQGLYNATVYEMANLLSGGSEFTLKSVLQSYNTDAQKQLNGGGLFGNVDKEGILTDILNTLGYEFRTKQPTGQPAADAAGTVAETGREATPPTEGNGEEVERPAAGQTAADAAGTVAGQPAADAAGTVAGQPAADAAGTVAGQPAADAAGTVAGTVEGEELEGLSDSDKARLEELRNRIRAKLRSQLNMGVDPEVFSMGAEMGFIYLKGGIRKFRAFAKRMISDIGNAIRPYIAACYEGARRLDVDKEFAQDMDSTEYVDNFDLGNLYDEVEKSDDEVADLIERMKARAVQEPIISFTDDNWSLLFGVDGVVNTPIGRVKMGENQKSKVIDRKRTDELGMIFYTLTNPDIVIEEKDEEGENLFHERPSSYLFIKTFVRKDGTKYRHYESVTISKDGKEVSISSHLISENQLSDKIKNGGLLYKATALDSPSTLSAEQSSEGGGLSSEGKGSENNYAVQENASEISEGEKKTLSLQADKAFENAVAEAMADALRTGEKPYKSILQLRAAAREAGMEVDENGKDDIKLQEIVEAALVRVARQEVQRSLADSVLDGEEVYNKVLFDTIKRLYELQPTLAARSGNRIDMQQYSTPLPMAFCADMFAYDYGRRGRVLEPTAGNGMLVFAIPGSDVTANELDETRLSNLRGQGYREVTGQDATQPFEGGRQYDAIIANPPFGSAEAKDYDGKSISGLEKQIAINALESMKDDGRAAVIVGGNMEYYPNGAIKGNDAGFYSWLYDNYNVKSVIDMDGKLYAKQGTTYPTRMILIDGRRSEEEKANSTVYPPVKDNAPAKATTFDELYEAINRIRNNNERTNGNEVLRSEERSDVADDKQRTGRSDGRSAGSQSADRSSDSGRGQRSGDGQSAERTAGNSERRGVEEQSENSERHAVGRTGIAEVSDRGEADTNRGEDGGGRADRGGRSDVSGRVDGRVQSGRTGSSDRVGLETPDEPVADSTGTVVGPKRKLGEEKAAYVSHSNGSYKIDSVLPAPMAEAMDEALKRVEEEYGPIDDFVQSELGYAAKEELFRALGDVQIDGVALALYQLKKGQAMIIGDQTGVGKGRQMAALIRWAVRQGKKPVFMTVKSDLFSDIYRDLKDVGSGDLVPFIFNADSDADMTDEDENGELKTVYKRQSDKALKKAAEEGKLPEGYDFVVLTYSQINKGDEISAEAGKPKKGKPSSQNKSKDMMKGRFLRALAKDNYLFLDESHNAAGEGNTGTYMQSIVEKAKGIVFASATFAKRPDSMPLYALRTVMSKANVAKDELINIIAKGGVTLQEIMSRALTAAGQMIRRERDMGDVKTDWKTVTDEDTVKKSRENYDKTVEAFNAIIDFQKTYVNPYIEQLSKQLASVMSSASKTRGTDKMGIENTPFACKAYNYTKQLMLALKSKAIVDEVEAEIKAGRKPVIALDNTMGSALDGYKDGDVIEEPTFAMSLYKGLEKVLSWQEKKSGVQKPIIHYFAPSELGPEGEQAYYELKERIRELAKDVFISPLDMITSELQKRGYNVGELTGRDLRLEQQEDGSAIVRNKKGKRKKELAHDFNSGRLDVLILNKSAATGISLHASKDFSDQRQRTMIIAQPLPDINDYMQMIGRIDRTGQVQRGYYINLGLPVPAENRFLMMLSTKLKSLNANTAAEQESSSNKVEAPDMLNKYGSRVVVEYLRDYPDIYEAMGKPLKKGNNTVEADKLDEYTPSADDSDVRKVTGYVALLPTEDQEAFYADVTQRYTDLIKYLDDTGTNDLKITVMPLRAETLDTKVSSKGNDPTGSNPFATDAIVEHVTMDVLKKPMKSSEVQKTIDSLRGEENGQERTDRLIGLVNEKFDKLEEEEKARYDKSKDDVEEAIERLTERVNARKSMTDEEKREEILESSERLRNESEERHESAVRRLRIQRESFIQHLERFKVGESYLVPDNLDEDTFLGSSPAIFCGFKAKEGNMTPSTTFAVFAVLDGRRKIELKLSDGLPLIRIGNQTFDNYDAAKYTNLGNWDEQAPKETRKEGYILTGNILQAVADTQMEGGVMPGQLVSYADIDGNVKDGVLMPDKWRPSQLRTSGVPISARLEQGRKLNNAQSIKSIDGNVEIKHIVSRDNPEKGLYQLIIPYAKKVNKKYRESDELNQYVTEYSNYTGKRLMAEFRQSDLPEVLNVLSRLGVRVEDDGIDAIDRIEAIDRIDAIDGIDAIDRERREGVRFRATADAAGTVEQLPSYDEVGEKTDDISYAAYTRDIEHAKRHEKTIEAFAEGHKGLGKVIVVVNRKHLEKVISDENLTKDESDRLRNNYGKANAAILPSGKVLILNTDSTKEEINDYLCHETAHKAIRRLFGRRKKEVVSRLYDLLLPFYEREFAELRGEYEFRVQADEEEWMEECVVKYIENMYSIYGDNAYQMLYAVNNDLGNIFNYILYGEENDTGGSDKGRSGSNEAGEELVLPDPSLEQREDERVGGVNLSLGRNSHTGTPLTGSAMREAWDKEIDKASYLLKETAVDYLASVDKFQQLLSKNSGKALLDTQNAWLLMNQLSSRNKEEMSWFDSFIVKPLNDAIYGLVGKVKDWNMGEARDLVRYVIAKHGIERNRDMAVRSKLKEESQSEYDAQMESALQPVQDKIDRLTSDLVALKDELDSLRTNGASATDIQDKKAEIEEKKKEIKAANDEYKDIKRFPKKHGLKTREDLYEEKLIDWYVRVSTIRSNAVLNDEPWKATQLKLDSEAYDIIGAKRDDYSGLSSVFEGETGITGRPSYVEAYDYVEEYEQRKDASAIAALWEAANAVNGYSLLKQQQTGLTDQKYLDDQSRRYEFFVPLRGFRDDTAQDVYNYITEEVHEMGNPVKTAKGRSSEAGNPFANMLNVGYRSIASGNRNQALQAFYNLVKSHDTDGQLAVVNPEWIENIGTEENPDWVVAEPNIPENATTEEVARLIDEFNTRMKKQRDLGTAVELKRGTPRPPYRILNARQQNAHTVKVHIGGRTRFITIVGNPRVAQALNGQLNPDSDSNMVVKKTMNIMAGAFTSYNASFSAANLVRDTMHATMRAFVNEDWKYFARFVKKQDLLLGNYDKWAKMMRLLYRYRKGDTPRNKTEKNFRDFMEHGGATGYTFIRSQKESLDYIDDMMKKLSTPGVLRWVNPKRIFELFHFAGEASELVNRFVAYETSLEMGRTRTRALSDAKEITLNFNRKGAGRKTGIGMEKEKFGGAKYSLVRAAVWSSDMGRRFILFFNAHVQGIYQMYEMFKANPVKASVAFLGVPITMHSLALPFLNNVLLPALYAAFGYGGGDDDDDKYGDYYDELSDWERSHYLCLRLPKNGRFGWLRIPITPDLGEITQLGDVAGASMMHKRKLTSGDFAGIVNLVSPVTINTQSALTTGVSLAPSVMQPVLHVMTNADFKGQALRRETMWNKYAPAYKKQMKNAGPMLTALSKAWNRAMGGNDYVTAGNMDINPTTMRELLEGLGGGYAKFAINLSDIAVAGTDEKSRKQVSVENMPIIDRFFTDGSSGHLNKRTKSLYYQNVKSFVDRIATEDRAREKAIKERMEAGIKDPMATAEAIGMQGELDEFHSSEDYKKYMIMQGSMKALDKMMDQYEDDDMPKVAIDLMKELIDLARE